MQGTGLCVGDSSCSGPTHRPAPAEILPLEQQEKSISFKNVIEVKCAECNYVDSQKIEASPYLGAGVCSGPTHRPAPTEILLLEQ